MSTTTSIVRAQSPLQWSSARRLVAEYVDSLGVDLSFQNYDEEIAHLEREYGPPRGALLLAMDGDEAVGCVGLRGFEGSTGEIKRLYVAPAARGRAVGRRLAGEAVAVARELGYQRLVLDTLPSMKTAQALYQSIGFRPIEPYRYNPVPGTVYMELVL